jgi:phosphoserine phosphatase
VNDAPPPYDTVVFDCDSTLSAVEGIDELASAAGPEVIAWVTDLTRRAMEGELGLEDVYGLRLERIRPTRDAVDQVGRLYVERAQPHAAALVRALQSLGKRVCVVSGGLYPAVAAVATAVGVAEEDVFAVGIQFAADGSYAGFEESSPLARSGGKPPLLREISATSGATCLIGDGVTDLEAAPEIARFIAFGGVERREPVFEAAAATCDKADFAALVPLLLAESEIEALAGRPEHAELVAAGLR